MFAAWFGNQQATVTGRAVEEAIFKGVACEMVGTHRIVRTESPSRECVLHVMSEASARLNDSAKRTFRTRTSRVNQNAVFAALERIDSFAQRRRGVATVGRDRRHKQMCKRVQEGIRSTREHALRIVVFAPGIEASREFVGSRNYARALQPFVNLGSGKLNEEALASALD